MTGGFNRQVGDWIKLRAGHVDRDHPREIATGLRRSVQGIQVSTQTGNIDAALGVLDGLR